MTIIQWAQQQLRINTAPELVQKTPWSEIHVFPTPTGKIFLKKTSALFASEADITQRLYEDYHARVPLIIAVNLALHCFLMEDAGLSLPQCDVSFQNKAIEAYLQIQQCSKDDIDHWIELGVPDWRLEKLPDLYAEFIRKKDFLIKQGVKDFDMLEKREAILKDLCEQLAQYHISPTLDHCDFHERNVLVQPQTQEVTIIDWSETVVTHPYFSWINYLRKSSRASEDLFSPNPKAWELAKKIWPVYAVLAFDRLIQASDQKAFKAYYADRPNRIAGYLREWMRN